MDLRPFYDKALANTRATAANVTAEQLAGETPCSEWSVRDLLNHIVSGHRMFAAFARGEGKPEAADHLGDDHVAAVEASAVDALAAINEPGSMDRVWPLAFGEMPGINAVRIMLLETVVHGWDLAKATGQDTAKNDLIAAQMLGGLKQMVPGGERTEGPFASEITVADDASDVDKLAAFLGRKP